MSRGIQSPPPRGFPIQKSCFGHPYPSKCPYSWRGTETPKGWGKYSDPAYESFILYLRKAHCDQKRDTIVFHAVKLRQFSDILLSCFNILMDFAVCIKILLNSAEIFVNCSAWTWKQSQWNASDLPLASVCLFVLCAHVSVKMVEGCGIVLIPAINQKFNLSKEGERRAKNPTSNKIFFLQSPFTKSFLLLLLTLSCDNLLNNVFKKITL